MPLIHVSSRKTRSSSAPPSHNDLTLEPELSFLRLVNSSRFVQSGVDGQRNPKSWVQPWRSLCSGFWNDLKPEKTDRRVDFGDQRQRFASEPGLGALLAEGRRHPRDIAKVQEWLGYSLFPPLTSMTAEGPNPRIAPTPHSW